MNRHRIDFWPWTLACGLAEFAGIAAAALWWVFIDRSAPSPDRLVNLLAMLALKSASGLIEGAILGFVQATALRRAYPQLSRLRWTAATMILASVGWLAGSIPSAITRGNGEAATSLDPSLPQVMLFASLFGLVVGAMFGGAQWLVFRHAAERSSLWIPANMLAWMIALPVIYLAASAGSGVADLWEVGVRALAGGLVAGLLLGATLYPSLRWITPGSSEP